MEILTIAIWVLLGFWCYSIAEKNGRNTILAVIMGLLFGIFAVAGYYIIGKKKENA